MEARGKRREVEQGLVFLENPFAFGSGSTGRYPSTGRSSYMFNANLLM